VQDADGSRRRYVRDWPPVGPPEAQLTIRLSFDLKALFVHRAVMSATQHREIRQLRRPAMCPVPNMVSLSKRQAAAWEATALVAMLKRAPQRGGNRAGSGADFRNPSIGIVPHHQRLASHARR
jgi:hypothetical protein